MSRGSFSKDDKKSQNNNNNEKEYKFSLHGNSKKGQQKATYTQVKNKICGIVQQTFTDGLLVANMLRNETKTTLTAPTRDISSESDEAAKKIEQETFDMIFKAEMEEHIRQRNLLKQNIGKAYALIFNEYCTTGMQHKVEQAANYETTIRNDPFELLKKVKVLMHNPSDKGYDYLSLVLALKTLLMMTQKENEGLHNYTGRIKQARDVVKSLMGKNFLDGFTENREVYNSVVATATATEQEQKDALKASAIDEFGACVFIMNSDKSKYGSLLSHLSTEINLGHDKYPKNVDDAMELLANHRWDTSRGNNPSDKAKRGGGADDRSGKGAEEEQTEEKSSPQGNFLQGDELRCYCCGSDKHLLPDCPEKDDVPRKDWWYKKQTKTKTEDQQGNSTEQQHLQQQDDEEYAQIAEQYNDLFTFQAAQAHTTTTTTTTTTIDDDGEVGNDAVQCLASWETLCGRRSDATEYTGVEYPTHTTNYTGKNTGVNGTPSKHKSGKKTGVTAQCNEADQKNDDVQAMTPGGNSPAGVCWTNVANTGVREQAFGEPPRRISQVSGAAAGRKESGTAPGDGLGVRIGESVPRAEMSPPG